MVLRLDVSAEIYELPYARPFGIARWTRDRTHDVLVCVRGAGLEGWGEGAPNARYGERAETTCAAFASLRAEGLDAPTALEEIGRLLAKLDVSAGNAGRAALDGALCDWLAKRQGLALAALLGIAPGPGPVSSYSIGLCGPDELTAALDAAERYPLYKIKLGADAEADAATLAAIRARTDRPLRVDANEAFVDREQALRRLEALARVGGVELCEQPLPAGRLDDVAWLRSRSPLPLVADEDCVPGADLQALAEAYDGVNIKLDKEGGILAARERVAAARGAGLSVMVGCMVSSSLALTQAAHVALSGARWADLDGHLLLADDPFTGLRLDDLGRVWLPSGLGLGARWRARPLAQPWPSPSS
jgi:L-alanine-DL-glutamate epimerase-like enolase superfamily enzyme